MGHFFGSRFWWGWWWVYEGVWVIPLAAAWNGEGEVPLLDFPSKASAETADRPQMADSMQVGQFLH